MRIQGEMAGRVRVPVLHILVVFGVVTLCGSVITVYPDDHHRTEPHRSGMINKRILGNGVKAKQFKLNHMVIAEWGRIFIGAVNRIYELDSDLNIITQVQTGPINDSRKCLPLAMDVECPHGFEPTDNHNKILIHYKGLKEKILTCGSIYQGACEARNLKNISRAHMYYDSQSGSMFDYAVAANSPEASTVAFIAPGPPDLQTEVLYVASTFSGDDSDDITKQLRDLVPALSTRSLGKNRFEFFAKTDSIQPKLSGIYLKKNVRTKYSIKYVTGFSSDEYSYFLTQQFETPYATSEFSKKVSKIVQICQEDTYYYSYVDMPIACRSDTSGREYNFLQDAQVIKASKNLQLSFGLRSAEDILIGVFTDDEGGIASNSAVCVFTMQFIRKKLLENVKLCYAGEDISGGGYLVKKQCHALDPFYRDKEYLCNRDLESIGNIVGRIPATTNAILEYKNTWLTAVALTMTTDHTVAIIGTGDGYIKKIVLETHERAREYDEILVDLGSPINQDIVLNRDFIFVMSQQKIAKLMLSSCKSRQTCNTCLADGDPFCGWCVLDNRCTERHNCPVSSSDRWLFGPPGQTCVAITDVSPRTVSVSERATLYLTIYQLPDGSNYTCVFPELNETAQAQVWSYGVFCQAPNVHATNLQIRGSKVLTIALNSSETGKVFLEQNFTFYNCSSFTSCNQCTNNSWTCDWCIYDNQCVHNSASLCQPGVVLSRTSTGVARNSQRISPASGKRGPLHCPRVDSMKTGTLFVPEGVRKDVVMQGINFPRPSNLGYECHVRVGNIVYKSNGTLSNNGSIICQLTNMMIPPYYTEGLYRAPIYIYWGHTYVVEDAMGSYVTIYKCEVLARGECGLCHSINYTRPQLQCNWCDSNCKYQTFCNNVVPEPCPAPQIQIVYPLTGPIGGGTLVNISGKDLGSKFEEVQNAVSIAGIRCAPLREKYQPSQWILCRLGASMIPRNGIVTVALPNRPAVNFHEKFSYQDPSITSIKPAIGPIAGGSMITIYGEHLDTGRTITASIDRQECSVIRNMVTSMIAFCETEVVAYPSKQPEPFRMYFDGYEESNVNVDFQYMANPAVSKIKPLYSFLSGGRMITVSGDNLHTVQQPRMFAIFTDGQGKISETEKEVCGAVNATQMLCPTPRIPHSVVQELSYRMRRSRRGSNMEVELGFMMDNVEAVRNLSESRVFSKMTYYPDPVVYNFTEADAIKTFKGEVLVFEGKGLNLAATVDDVQIFIGDKICNVTNLSESQIFCTPPADQPTGHGEHGYEDSAFPIVVVKIGNLKFQVGKLEYETVASFEFPVEYFMGIAAGGGFMLLIILLILIICRRQSHRAETNYRKMQLLLDNLESNVRNECKQAFAELQTDITDLTTDLEGGGIPFWDYHTYTFKVLFPGLSDHVILHPPVMEQKNGSVGFTEHGLQHFYHLLSNKYFLLLLIRTLELQKTFSIRDKVNVASLLMVIYQDNMEYATDILKALLNELMEKSVMGKHPKLMLRRTESVVEKMLTNWLSLCMYKYLRDLCGSSLYVMYRAIKLHVEKGPVDCMTGDARYTLSEDKLLREKIDPKLLTLHVFYEGEVTHCKVLNCDTITQAKEKIIDQLYRNIPFSNRPWACDLDLEWKKGTIPVTLQDEDSSSQKFEGWKKINTLQHYRVFDNSDCALIRRYQTIKSPNGSLDTSVVSSNSSVPFLRTESDTATKFFHLVKHDDIQTKEGVVKMVPEVYLPRLLATKGTLQKYIDDYFRTLLSVNPMMPPVIKYLFDYLDDAAIKYGITDPDVLHTWKCNSLPLRFWVNIMKNPDFVFDIHKPLIVDSCLSVVAQTFMDSCSTSEHRLGKDSPSNKLLFAKDIPNYRKMVDRFYRDIHDMAPISEQEMSSYLGAVSRVCHNSYYLSYPGKVYKSSALKELYKYISKYGTELMEVLDQDPVSMRMQLANKLGTVITAMEGPNSGRQAFV